MTVRGRCLNPQPLECGSLAAADRIRHEYSDCIIPADDARKRTVAYCGDAPQRARKAIERAAYHSHQDTGGFGQTPLTRFERQSINFSRTNVFHARACKAISVEFAVDDWTAYYDHTLSVSEHIEIYERAGGPTARSGPTMRQIAGAGWSA